MEADDALLRRQDPPEMLLCVKMDRDGPRETRPAAAKRRRRPRDEISVDSLPYRNHVSHIGSRQALATLAGMERFQLL